MAHVQEQIDLLQERIDNLASAVPELTAAVIEVHGYGRAMPTNAKEHEQRVRSHALEAERLTVREILAP
jgi:hypothetical protein